MCLHHAIDFYQRLLKKSLRFPKITLICICVCVATAGYFDLQLPKTFLPADPDGTINIIINATNQDTVKSLRKKLAVFAPFYQSKAVRSRNVQISQNPMSGVLTAFLDLHYQPQYLHQIPLYTQKINQFAKQQHMKNTMIQMEKVTNFYGRQQ